MAMYNFLLIFRYIRINDAQYNETRIVRLQALLAFLFPS
jgi:hypothetical protein